MTLCSTALLPDKCGLNELERALAKVGPAKYMTSWKASLVGLLGLTATNLGIQNLSSYKLKECYIGSCVGSHPGLTTVVTVGSFTGRRIMCANLFTGAHRH